MIIFHISCKKAELPLVEATFSAGFPSPANDYFEARLNLNKKLISNQIATFYACIKAIR